MKKAVALLVLVVVLAGGLAHRHQTDLSATSDGCAACTLGHSATTPTMPAAAAAPPPPRLVAVVPLAVPRGPSTLRLLAVAPKTSPPVFVLQLA